MKRFVICLAVIVGVALAAPLFAGQGNNGLSGPHWQFNLIGSKNGTSGDTSGGRAIMIPLKNATGPNEIVCEADEIVFEDDEVPTFQTLEPAGAKIHFVSGGESEFEITDRDATDGNAWITIPTIDADGEQVLNVDVWVRILGKPNTCLDIDAFAFDEQQGLYFFAGSVGLNRKTGKATWFNVNFLFDVHFCQVDTTTGLCVPGTEDELSVFNDVFEDYFWSILNNGARIVQVRLYPR